MASHWFTTGSLGCTPDIAFCPTLENLVGFFDARHVSACWGRTISVNRSHHWSCIIIFIELFSPLPDLVPQCATPIFNQCNLVADYRPGVGWNKSRAGPGRQDSRRKRQRGKQVLLSDCTPNGMEPTLFCAHSSKNVIANKQTNWDVTKTCRNMHKQQHWRWPTRRGPGMSNWCKLIHPYNWFHSPICRHVSIVGVSMWACPKMGHAVNGQFWW